MWSEAFGASLSVFILIESRLLSSVSRVITSDLLAQSVPLAVSLILCPRALAGSVCSCSSLIS